MINSVRKRIRYTLIYLFSSIRDSLRIADALSLASGGSDTVSERFFLYGVSGVQKSLNLGLEISEEERYQLQSLLSTAFSQYGLYLCENERWIEAERVFIEDLLLSLQIKDRV